MRNLGDSFTKWDSTDYYSWDSIELNYEKKQRYTLQYLVNCDVTSETFLKCKVSGFAKTKQF